MQAEAAASVGSPAPRALAAAVSACCARPSLRSAARPRRVASISASCTALSRCVASEEELRPSSAYCASSCAVYG